MIRRALLAAAIMLAAGAGETVWAAAPLEIWVDVDGTAYLHNTTGAPISFDGYQIATEDGIFDPLGWNSIADQAAADPVGIIGKLGAGALSFGEANPGPGNVAELNLGGVATLPGGAKFAIGKPFGEGGYYIDFFYKVGGQVNSVPGDAIFVPPRIPEPSTFLLATLAGVGLLAFRLRARCRIQA